MKKYSIQHINHLSHKSKKFNQRNKRYISPKYISANNIRLKAEQIILDRTTCKFFEYFKNKKSFNHITAFDDNSNTIEIPEIFSLNSDSDTTFKDIFSFYFRLHQCRTTEFYFDFTNCKETDETTLFFFRIMINKFKDYRQKLKNRLQYIDPFPTIKIRNSKKDEVNVLLNIAGLHNQQEKECNLAPLSAIGYYKGYKNQKHYLENKKGLYCEKLVNYINSCYKSHDVELSDLGRNKIGLMIGELLSNLEDHNSFNEYYFCANFLLTKNKDKTTEEAGILNLFFLNFGESISDYLINKDELKDIKYCKDIFKENHETIVDYKLEDYLTLFSLNQKISRLNKEDASRGTGTITFINCFFEIGDYTNESLGVAPEINIFSGSTHVKIPKKYEPFEKNNRFFISLNSNKTLVIPADKDFLKSKKFNLPGTLLNFKACLNREHLTSKTQN